MQNLSADDYDEYMKQFSASLSCNASLPTTTTLWCSMEGVRAAYLPYHGTLATMVCVLGTLSNILNILVLAHKDMRTNPINLILTGIAVADCLVMVEYILFTLHMYL